MSRIFCWLPSAGGSSTLYSLHCLLFLLVLISSSHGFSLVPSSPPTKCATSPIQSRTCNRLVALKSSAADLNTAHEWLARQRGPPVSNHITWFDPLEETLLSPPERCMGFEIDASVSPDGTENDRSGMSSSSGNASRRRDEKALRVPIYPVSAVHVLSSAYQTLHNVEEKNLRMAHDLKGGMWNLECPMLVGGNGSGSGNAIVNAGNDDGTRSSNDNDSDSDSSRSNNSKKEGGYFCLVLRAHDTHRIARIGTLMQVTSFNEVYSDADKKQIQRIVVQCQARGIVHIVGVEKAKSPLDYWIGRVELREVLLSQDKEDDEEELMKDAKEEEEEEEYLMNGVAEASKMDETDLQLTIPNSNGSTYSEVTNQNCHPSSKLDHEIIKGIIQDYATVRSMYIYSNGVASRELPVYARHAVQSNLPPFTSSDLLSNFWNVVECWQMLCHTVRECRRSILQANVNEIMIEAACQLGGPLTLPVKRMTLSEQVQRTLHHLEQEASDDFISCGMEPCLDFQALIGMVPSSPLDESSISEEEREELLMRRILLLGTMIAREKDRLETKEKLKDMFEEKDGDKKESNNDHFFE